ncbi:MAG: hypothetical protein Q8S13_05865 [Dehalococcoidia bacterium]|nr:hypothetical protein [Dehalococcoidia bacterium]
MKKADVVSHHPGCICAVCKPAVRGCLCKKCLRLIAAREPALPPGVTPGPTGTAS